MLKRAVALKAMMRSLVHQGRYGICLETEKGLLMKINEDLLSSSSQPAAIRCQVADWYFTNTPPLFLNLVIDMSRQESDRNVLRHALSGLEPFIFEPRR